MASHHRFSRAQRRHHYERLKKARQHYWGGVPQGWEPDKTWCARRLARLTRTPHPCSCFLCRSPRKHRGNGLGALTQQEVRFLLTWKEGRAEAETPDGHPSCPESV